MRVLIISNTPGIAKEYAIQHQLSDWKWIWEMRDLLDEPEETLAHFAFIEDHIEIPIDKWFVIRKEVERRVQQGTGKWFVHT